MKHLNKLAFASPLVVLGAQVQAAVPASVTDAIDSTSADISTVGAAIIGLAVVAMGIRWIKATFF